jgi:hypothetical protein
MEDREPETADFHLPITGATPAFLAGKKFRIQELWK